MEPDDFTANIDVTPVIGILPTHIQSREIHHHTLLLEEGGLLSDHLQWWDSDTQCHTRSLPPNTHSNTQLLSPLSE